MVESIELYDILELDPGCSSSDIKKAYRKMAMQHHPDKNPGASHEKFQAIQGAYEILSDPEQRETYDQYGLSGVNGGNGMDGEAFDVNDLFASMFGGGHPGFGFSHHSHSHSHSDHKHQKKARGDDQIVEFNVTLEDAFTGKETTVELEKDIVCTSCKGVGGKKGVKARKCGGCSGKGIVMMERMVGPGMVAMSQTECPDCKGDGETFKSQDKCKKCKGKKTVKSKNRVGVYIEKGARDGDKVVLRGEGEQYPDQKPGDVILILSVEDHDTFTLDKKNNNLFTEVTVTLSEALLGFDRLLLTHLDGRGIRVNQPTPGQPGYKVFSTGDVVKVDGEGFPKRKSAIRGDLFMKITVTMPSKNEMEALTSKHVAYLTKALPPKLPDVTNPAVTDEVELVSVDESEWKDEGDDEDGPSQSYGTNASFDYGSDGSPQPQCAHQ